MERSKKREDTLGCNPADIPSSIIFQTGSSNRVWASGFARIVSLGEDVKLHPVTPLERFRASEITASRDSVFDIEILYLYNMSLFPVITNIEKCISLASLSSSPPPLSFSFSL